MTTIPITLIFADGAARLVAAEAGQSVVDAASAAGLGLLVDCSNGQCGTCAASLVSGSIELGPYDRSVLPDADRAAGAILTCISRVTGPCAIELPYDLSEATAEALPPIEGRVRSIARVALETIRLEIEIDEPLHFQPGQYVRIRPHGGSEWRSYSMANGSGGTTLVFYARLVASGVFSTWLAEVAAVGATVDVSEPHGRFFLRDEDRPRLFVAGGTGLAPFLSMLEAIATDERRAALPTTLLMGVRSGAHLFGVDEIERLKTRLPGLNIEYTAEADPAERCRSGYATDLIASLSLDPRTRVYLCGPPPMVEAGRAPADLGRPEAEPVARCCATASTEETAMTSPLTYHAMVNPKAGTISREIFSSRQVYEDELEKVFTRAWLFVGHESQIPKAGDYFTSRMGA